MNKNIDQFYYIEELLSITQQLTKWDLQAVEGEGAFIKYTGKYGHIKIKIYEGNQFSSNLIWNVDEKFLPINYISPDIEKCIEFFCNYLSIIKGKRITLSFEIIDGSFHPVDSASKYYGIATIFAIINCFDKEYNPISDAKNP